MSIIDICNEALAKNQFMDTIPADADLTAPVGKAQTVCARFVDSSRRAILRMGPWGSIMKRTPLAKDGWEAATEYELLDLLVTALGVFACTTAGTSGATVPTWSTTAAVTDGTAVWTFQYAIKVQLPAEHYYGLDYAYAVPEECVNLVEVRTKAGKRVHFEFERGVLYSDSEEPVLNYIPDEEDDTVYDVLLRSVVVLQLASDIAYPMTNNHENEIAYAQAATSIARAAFRKAKAEQRQGTPPSEPWVEGIFNERYTP